MPEALSSHLSLIPHPTLHTQDGFREGKGRPAGKDPSWPPLHDPKLMLFCYPRQRPRHEAPAKDGPCSSHTATAQPGPARGEAAWTQAPHAVHSLAAGPGAPGAVLGGLRHLAPAGDLGVDHAAQSQGVVAAQRACRRPGSIAGMEAARAPLPGRAPRLLLSRLGGSGKVTEPLSFLMGEMRIKAALNSPS